MAEGRPSAGPALQQETQSPRGLFGPLAGGAVVCVLPLHHIRPEKPTAVCMESGDAGCSVTLQPHGGDCHSGFIIPALFRWLSENPSHLIH